MYLIQEEGGTFLTAGEVLAIELSDNEELTAVLLEGEVTQPLDQERNTSE